MFTKLVVVRVLDFMKVVFVQLSDKRRKIGVFEHPGENGFREFGHVLARSQQTKQYGAEKRRTLTTKQSPWGPHETTDWKDGSSSILESKR
jgi:hypothetical protein